MVLNLLLLSRIPVVLARLRTGPHIDGNLCGINGKSCGDRVNLILVLVLLSGVSSYWHISLIAVGGIA